MQFVSFMGSGLSDAAGLEADDLPVSLGVAHVDVRVAIAADYLSVGRRCLNIGQGCDHGRDSVKTHLAVGKVEHSEMKPTGAQALQGFITGLESA